jgi:hypothetical protein
MYHCEEVIKAANFGWYHGELLIKKHLIYCVRDQWILTELFPVLLIVKLKDCNCKYKKSINHTTILLQLVPYLHVLCTTPITPIFYINTCPACRFSRRHLFHQQKSTSRTSVPKYSLTWVLVKVTRHLQPLLEISLARNKMK